MDGRPEFPCLIIISPHPEEIHGINMIPVTAASLYLGRRPSQMDEYYQFMLRMKGSGAESMWQDIIWKWQSLYYPSDAYNKFNLGDYPVEDGTT